jgi:hypothetical protein
MPKPHKPIIQVLSNMDTKDILLALINEANVLDHPLDATSVTLSQPDVNTATAKNTKITVVAVNQSGYKGSIEVHYDRLGVDLVEPEQGIRSEDVFTTQAVLTALSPIVGVQLTAADVDMVIPDLEVGDIATITVTAKPDSLGWQGSVQVALLYGLPPTSDDLYDLMNTVFP